MAAKATLADAPRAGMAVEAALAAFRGSEWPPRRPWRRSESGERHRSSFGSGPEFCERLRGGFDGGRGSEMAFDAALAAFRGSAGAPRALRGRSEVQDGGRGGVGGPFGDRDSGQGGFDGRSRTRVTAQEALADDPHPKSLSRQPPDRSAAPARKARSTEAPHARRLRLQREDGSSGGSMGGAESAGESSPAEPVTSRSRSVSSSESTLLRCVSARSSKMSGISASRL